jgi:phosphatidylglycerophosphate synthase
MFRPFSARARGAPLQQPAIWIDARQEDRHRIFGLTLLERALRGVLEAGLAPPRVEVALAPGAAEPALPADLARALPLHFSHADGGAGACLARARRALEGRPWIALAADSVVDPRLLAHLAGSTSSQGVLERPEGDAGRGAALLRLDPGAPDPAPDAATVREIAERGLARGDLKPFVEDEFDGYVQKLRRSVGPYLFEIDGAETIARVERFLFWSNYKGSTDFMTRYVYPPLVWALVRPLSHWRVHPNWITTINWVATFGCIPLFAEGAWLPGLALAYLMSVMDSVDGKLARLTYTSSRIGDLMDHGLDIVHPPFWYMAWGYALGGGTTTSAPWQASLAMLAIYAVDRVVTAIFRQKTGASIHGATPLDVRMRTFISRRNVNLAVFTVALAIDAALGTGVVALASFYAIVAWQGFSLVWHLQRLVAFWGTRLR